MAKKPPFENAPQIDVELPAELAEGSYSNLVMISHSPTEFVFDFITMLPGLPKPRVISRIVMSPEHAQNFLNALKENIEMYENSFGKIRSGNITIPFGKIGEA
ncbi:DUF3467 domain-containing protein [Raineya orbicola]|jgi:hypothetical protein|uniref:DUF3467 domain-containing protein n=1 Tax=Raineya orbicola TaxID=2016530 RepID=A0A2N3IDE2_9BACT|nr:DUF3467 domain-containing protein [Raineya orbicola]PKQ68298.1 hypothetical protein Rain11_1766 [Raineya orbicola]